MRLVLCKFRPSPITHIKFGRSPTGRAIRCNAFLPQAQHKKTFPLLSLTRKTRAINPFWLITKQAKVRV
jgi:hypothetical protein